MWFAVDTPLGPLSVQMADGLVVGVRFGAVPEAVVRPAPTNVVARELAAYFAGSSMAIAVPYEVRGGSAFERAVWDRIAAIPYGATMTYGSIAAELGEPGAARAVGTACNRNPVPVLVPCHRVVGAGGKLVGFGGGLDRKRRMLELEARVGVEHAWGPDPRPGPRVA